MAIRQRAFEVDRPEGPLGCLLLEPGPDRLAPAPALLLAITATRDELTADVHRIPADVFLEHGHRVLAFDLPHHGDRVTPGGREGLEGMCDELIAGGDPFARLIDDGKAVIDACVERGLADPARTVAAGVSRGGYCALRLAAEEPRLASVAALAPVTDWLLVREFAAERDRLPLTPLSLDDCVAPLADRPIYTAIGAGDDRVGTHRCAQWMAALLDAQRHTPAFGRSCFHVDPGSEGHGLAGEWYRQGALFLLNVIAGVDAPAMDAA